MGGAGWVRVPVEVQVGSGSGAPAAAAVGPELPAPAESARWAWTGPRRPHLLRSHTAQHVTTEQNIPSHTTQLFYRSSDENLISFHTNSLH